jgi:c-di-GMP-binding flagellar brake protein YcgR
MIALFVGIVIVLFFVSLLFFLRGRKRYSWLEYYLKGRDAGFSMVETRALSDAATRAGLEDPTNIFWSPRDLDRTISSLVVPGSPIRGLGAPGSRESSAFVEKVYDLRKRLEFDQPRYKAGIRSSRQIAQGQRIRLLVQGVGVFGCTVMDNNSQFIVVTYPSGARLPPDFVWKGKKVSVYFWRREDAGYVFDSYIHDDMCIRNIPVIHLAHSESLLRTQKRKSVRSRAKSPAYLYILKRIEGAFEKPERDMGLRCVVQDLSEDGFSVLIGGKGRLGMTVKVQFFLGERQIVMSGTVRSLDYDQEANRTVLHVEAVTPSQRTRNAIRSYVYNIGEAEAGELEPQA